MFRPELCESCGECLVRCPVMRMTPERARRAVRSLSSGLYVREVLDHCTGCFSCEAVCSRGAHPYGRLLSFYDARYRRRGIPAVFRGAMPGGDGPDIWRGLERWYTPAERADLSRWTGEPAGDEVVFLGCNQRLTPYVAGSALLEGATLFTDPTTCCGEFYLRLGMLDVAREKASRLAARFSELGIKKVTAFCPACLNTMRNLAPLVLGVEFEVELEGLVDMLLRRLDEGSLVLRRRLSGTVTVQDPCHASMLGPGTIEDVRKLLGATGLEVVEMESSGAMAECCGLGASIARYRLTDVVRTGLRRMGSARKTGADRACAWCNGCYMVMNMFRLVYPWGPPVHHLLELFEVAAGAETAGKVPSRPLQLLASAVSTAACGGFGFRRVMI